MQKGRDYADELYKAFACFFSCCLEKESLAVDPSSFEGDKNSKTRFQVSIYVAGFLVRLSGCLYLSFKFEILPEIHFLVPGSLLSVPKRGPSNL